jgi:hydrogenase-4 membrane subunit HyfE
MAFALFGLMVVLGAVLVTFSAQKLRKRLSAGVTAKSEVVALSPLALGILFVVYGITAISKIIGLGELSGGTALTMANVAAQSIPVVIIFFIAYTFRSRQRHS